MRIPKGILKIANLSPSDGSERHAMNAVHIHRLPQPGRCRAEVTDGMSAIRVDFDEPASDVLPGFGVKEEVVDGFAVLVNRDDALAANDAIGADRYLIIDEVADGGLLKMVAPEDTQVMFEGHPVDGKFPPIDDVIPHYDVLTTTTAAATGKPIAAVRFGVSIGQLIQTLKSMQAAAQCDAVAIEAPTLPNRALKLIPLNKGRQVQMTVLLMPFRLNDVGLGDFPYGRAVDFSTAGDVPQEVQLPLPTGDQPAGQDPADAAVGEFDGMEIAAIAGLPTRAMSALTLDGITHGRQLREWLNGQPPRKVPGISDATRQKIGDAVADWFVAKTPATKGSPDGSSHQVQEETQPQPDVRTDDHATDQQAEAEADAATAGKVAGGVEGEPTQADGDAGGDGVQPMPAGSAGDEKPTESSDSRSNQQSRRPSVSEFLSSKDQAPVTPATKSQPAAPAESGPVQLVPTSVEVRGGAVYSDVKSSDYRQMMSGLGCSMRVAPRLNGDHCYWFQLSYRTSSPVTRDWTGYYDTKDEATLAAFDDIEGVIAEDEGASRLPNAAKKTLQTIVQEIANGRRRITDRRARESHARRSTSPAAVVAADTAGAGAATVG